MASPVVHYLFCRTEQRGESLLHRLLSGNGLLFRQYRRDRNLEQGFICIRNPELCSAIPFTIESFANNTGCVLAIKPGCSDSTANHNNGTITGSASWLTGVFRELFDFEWKRELYDCLDSSTLNIQVISHRRMDQNCGDGGRRICAKVSGNNGICVKD